MNIEGRKVLVVGLGKTGAALCQFLLDRKARVKVSEKRPPGELAAEIQYWKKKGIFLEAGGHNLQSFLDVDLIVPSPGVPHLPEMDVARAKGIPILSEIELAFRFLKGKIIGITGSNGKSTTATLTHSILKDGGLASFLAGNIGTPLISFVEKSAKNHLYVTEISSFQLEYIDRFHASVAVYLNLTPDHLDWHKSFSSYSAAKNKLILSQKREEFSILNRDDPHIWNLSEFAPARVLAFSQKEEIERGCRLKGEWIVLKEPEERNLMKISEVPLLGAHNLENVMAASIVGKLFSIPSSRIRESILQFSGLEHRLEKVAAIEGIEFFNDSKATNVDAAVKSIRSLKKPIVLILGGRDKGGNFEKLRDPVRERVKKIILMGEAQARIQKALIGIVPLESVSSLEEAVRIGFFSAEKGDAVLLAPACTSFDMFNNFEERGKTFKEKVNALKETRTHAS